MKKLALSIISLLACLIALGQDTLFTYDVKPAAGGQNILQAADEKNNRLYIFLVSKKSIEGLEIDLTTNQLISQLTGKKEDEPLYYTYYGALVNNRRIQLIFDGDAEDKFRILNFDFSAKTFFIRNPEADGIKQWEVQSFVFNNAFYYLKLRARSSTFVLHKLEPGDTFSKTTFDFTKDFEPAKQTVFDVLTTKNALSVIPYRDLLVQPVSTMFESSLSETEPLRKLYFFDDQIIITSDDREFTHVWQMKPDSKQMKYARVDKAFMNTAGDANVASNSYVYGQWLFQLQSIKRQAGVRVFDLSADTTMATFMIGDTSKVEITGMSTRATLYYRNLLLAPRKSTSTKEVTDVNAFLQKIYGKRLAIAVVGFPDALLLKLGGRKLEFNTYGGSTGASTPFGMKWTGFGIVPTGSYDVLMSAIIDRTTFPVKEKTSTPTPAEYISNYAAAFENIIDGQAATRLKEKDIYSYYNKKDRKLMVIAFPRSK